MKYTDQLKNGKWQKKRLFVMARDEFKCRKCGEEGFLNVHHLKYTGNAWEAPSRDLITWCDPCHNGFHNWKKIFTYIAYIRAVFNCVLNSPYSKEKSTFIEELEIKA